MAYRPRWQKKFFSYKLKKMFIKCQNNMLTYLMFNILQFNNSTFIVHNSKVESLMSNSSYRQLLVAIAVIVINNKSYITTDS